MGFWLTELHEVDTALKWMPLERLVRLRSLLDQATESQSLIDGETAAADAARLGFHKLFLLESREDALRTDLHTRCRDVIDGLAQIGSRQSEVAMQMVYDHAQELSTPGFWAVYFNELEWPPRLQPLPTSVGDVRRMRASWESVDLLLRAGYVERAFIMADPTEKFSALYREDESGYTPRERQIRDHADWVRRRYTRLMAELDEAERTRNLPAMESVLDQLDAFVVDSKRTKQLRARLPEMREQRVVEWRW